MNQFLRELLLHFLLRTGVSISLIFVVASVSRADTDEILDGPLEGLGATDEVLSPPGLNRPLTHFGPSPFTTRIEVDSCILMTMTDTISLIQRPPGTMTAP